jgi:hypothetical protein
VTRPDSPPKSAGRNGQDWDWKDPTSDLWDNDPKFQRFEDMPPGMQNSIREMCGKIFGDQAKLPGKPGSPDRV